MENNCFTHCKLCGRKLKKYSLTGYGAVCYKKIKRDRYKLIPLIKVKEGK